MGPQKGSFLEGEWDPLFQGNPGWPVSCRLQAWWPAMAEWKREIQVGETHLQHRAQSANVCESESGKIRFSDY